MSRLWRCTGCWFHVTQSIIKRVHKLGLKDEQKIFASGGTTAGGGQKFHWGGAPPGLLLEPPLTSTVYMSEPDVQDIVHCLLGLPLLPADEICPAFDDVKLVASNDSRFVNKLNDLLRYAGRHRTQKHSIGLARLCAVITGAEQTAS